MLPKNQSATKSSCSAQHASWTRRPLVVREPASPRRRPSVAAAAAADGAGLPSGARSAADVLATTSTSSAAAAQSSPAGEGSGAGEGACAGQRAAAPGPSTMSAAQQSEEKEQEATSLLVWVKRFFTGPKLDKARLAALGFGAFSAYGVISNINAGILITIAWLTVVRTTGLTPLDGSNWPRFLAIYAGLWVGSNFLRPLRLTLALAATPLFDAAIGAVSRRTGLPRVPAFVLMLVLIAVGTTSTLVASLALLGGFPPGCQLPWQPSLPA